MSMKANIGVAQRTTLLPLSISSIIVSPHLSLNRISLSVTLFRLRSTERLEAYLLFINANELAEKFYVSVIALNSKHPGIKDVN